MLTGEDGWTVTNPEEEILDISQIWNRDRERGWKLPGEWKPLWRPSKNARGTSVDKMIRTNTPITRTLHRRFPPPPPPPPFIIISPVQIQIKMPYQRIGSSLLGINTHSATAFNLLDRIVSFPLLLLLLTRKKEGKIEDTPQLCFRTCGTVSAVRLFIQLARSISGLYHVFFSHGGYFIFIL